MTLAAILRHKNSSTASAGKAAAGVVHVGPEDRLGQVARVLAERRIGAVLVLDESGGLLGILSERDIIRALAGHGKDALELAARMVMTAPVCVAGPEMTVGEAMQLMTDRRFRHLPVYEGGKLLGIVSIGDVVKARITQAETDVDSLRAYVAGAA